MGQLCVRTGWREEVKQMRVVKSHLMSIIRCSNVETVFHLMALQKTSSHLIE